MPAGSSELSSLLPAGSVLPSGERHQVPTSDGGQLHAIAEGAGRPLVLTHGGVAVAGGLGAAVAAAAGRQPPGHRRRPTRPWALHPRTVRLRRAGLHAGPGRRAGPLRRPPRRGGGPLHRRDRRPGPGGHRTARRRRPLGTLFTRTLFGSDPDPDLVEFARRIMAAAPRQTTTDAAKAVWRFDLRDRLDQVTLPTLVLSGTKDRSVKPEHARALADGIPEARLQRFPGAGHLVVLERAEPIAPAVTEFAASCA